MSISLKSNNDGTASVQLNGVDVLNIDASGRLVQVNAAGSVVGNARNAVFTGGAFTADEAVVESALGGAPVRLANVNKTIAAALNTTGVGGMDTGTGPVNGFVGIYLIYNPTTQASGLLATNATAATVPEIYGGANMPAGYTHSALICVAPTGSGGGLGTFYAVGRSVYIGSISVLSGGSQATYTSFSLAVAVPKNAKAWGGYVTVTATAATTSASTLNIAATSGGLANRSVQIPGNANNLITSVPIDNVPILTAQTAYFFTGSPNGNSVNVNNYTF